MSEPTGKGMFWTGVVITGVVTLFMSMAIFMELTKGQQVMEGMMKYGYPEGVIQYIGAALLVSTVLYAIPRTTVLGAILLTGYLGGAVATHVRAQEMQFIMPVIFGALTWAGVFLRDARLRQLLPWSK
jgi:DoxX-like family